MGTITISVDDEVEEEFRRKVKKEKGEKKGALGQGITEALNKWIREKEQEKVTRDLIGLMEEGFEMGDILWKKREELHRGER